MTDEEYQLALCEAHIRHPHARYIEVIKFDPERWMEIYQQLRFRWPEYEDVEHSCPNQIQGRNGSVKQGDWIILNDAPRHVEVLGGIRAAELR